MNIERARENIQFAYDFLYGTRPKEWGMSSVQQSLSEALRELQPEPRVIDWQRVVDQQLPVFVWSANASKERGSLAFLADYKPSALFPFVAHFTSYGFASLETGQWVFNSTGENVWPEGVLVEVWFNSRPKQLSGFWRADECLWGFSGGLSDRIIASRAVGLEPDWSYGGGE